MFGAARLLVEATAPAVYAPQLAARLEKISALQLMNYIEDILQKMRFQKTRRRSLVKTFFTRRSFLTARGGRCMLQAGAALPI